MKECERIREARAIEGFELSGDPCELNRVPGDVRVERDEEGVPVAERVRRIATEPARRSLLRNQLRDRGQRVVQDDRKLLEPFRISLAGRIVPIHRFTTDAGFGFGTAVPKAVRTIPLGRHAVAALKSHRERVTRTALADLVFGNRSGKPLRESKLLRNVLQPAAEGRGSAG